MKNGKASMMAVCGLVLAMGGCASATAPGSHATRTAADVSGFRVEKRGERTLYCKRELVTGSRTNVTETCLTAQQMEKARTSGLDVVRRLEENSGTSKPAVNGFGGQMIGPAVQ